MLSSDLHEAKLKAPLFLHAGGGPHTTLVRKRSRESELHTRILAELPGHGASRGLKAVSNPAPPQRPILFCHTSAYSAEPSVPVTMSSM